MNKRNSLVKHKIPDNLASIEHKLFVASLIYDLNLQKKSKQCSIYGIDLLSRKICPNIEMLELFLSEILNEKFVTPAIYGAEFILPVKLLKQLSIDKLKIECLQHKDELLNFWTSISVYETIEYINQLLFKINSKGVLPENAQPILNRLSEDFSAGQLWNISYKASQRVCEIVLIQKIDEEDYPNVFMQVILEKGLLYINKGWQILPFKRWGNQCRQSDLSKFFFDEVLEIGEDGFNLKPSIENLKIKD